ncbi:hypothetical protein Vadar_025227 [Vaccinium darrowii]|uniref:Uncharacterized protein n=1 Tax=Vaccinium darrowii TaxID=229202 RepID=A0ACB7Y1D6_9ERIC|nr:hypothetical protein Vadar_025227 [Vaccinium darrowii]
MKAGTPDSEGHKPENSQNHHHRYRHYFLRYGSRVPLVLGAFLVIFFVLYRSASLFQVFPRWSSSSSPFRQGSALTNVPSSAPEKSERDKLNDVLEKAAMGDKTVIMTTLNDAWAEPNSIFDLFLESFKTGIDTKRLLNHLVVIAMDQKAYDRCLILHPHCYFLITKGKDFSGDAFFLSPEYLDMMWRRILFLQSVLELGYNFVFTDTDIMWFRDPFPHFYSDADFQISCDFYWNSWDMKNNPNGGFNYVKSSNHSINFYKFWYNSRTNYTNMHDQDVLNKIKYDPMLREIGITIKFLDTAYFGGFCQPSRDLNKVCTMHANCCIGLDRKIHDLKIMLEDWRKYLALPDDERASRPNSWTVPQNCSLKGLVPP